ncbi:MAG: proton-conducting transporter membrane subunit [Conexivisphaerales archaeon]
MSLLPILLIALSSYVVGIILSAFSKRASYLMGSIAALFLFVLSVAVLVTGSSVPLVELGIFHLGLSVRASYFLLISSIVWFSVSIFSLDYDSDYSNKLSLLVLLSMLSMFLIMLSMDSISFLASWETMTIASFFMILQGEGDRGPLRQAAYTFLVFGELSTLLVTLSFAGIFAASHSFYLGDQISITSMIQSSSIFLLALLGFSMKMGIAPFHMVEWLPMAHSRAPTNSSALLSSTLTLMGVYGIFQVLYTLRNYQLWWGWITLGIGALPVLFGALYGAVSEHSKGVPAYSTIENNGLILVSFGIYILSSYYNLMLLATFSLLAAMFHSFSHSVSKGSLFLISGWAGKLRGSFDLNKQTHFDKKNTLLTIIGMFAILSLQAAPPIAGFVSEWMILESIFQFFRFPDIISQLICIFIGAVVALATGMTMVSMTKLYGFGILVQTNSSEETAQPKLIYAALILLSSVIVVLGVAAPLTLYLAAKGIESVVGTFVFNVFATGLLGVPAYFVILSGKPFGGFSPTFTALFLLGCLLVPAMISRYGGRWRIRRTRGWYAGEKGEEDSPNRYNSFGYSSPIRLMLSFLLRTKESKLKVGDGDEKDSRILVNLSTFDLFKPIYDVLSKWGNVVSSFVSSKIMQGNLGMYVAYILIAMVFVLGYYVLSMGL